MLNLNNEKPLFLRGFKGGPTCPWNNSFDSRRRSNINTINKNIKFKSNEKEILFKFCKNILKTKHYHFFIFGHRHLPLELDLGNNSKYMNTGDWITNFSYIVYDGSSFSLKYFKK